MEKLAYVIAAVSAIAIAAPSIASAETIVVKHDHHHMDRSWHHGWHHHDRTMIIKHHRHEG